MARPGRRAEPALVGAPVWAEVVLLPAGGTPVPIGVTLVMTVVETPVPAGVEEAGAELAGAELTGAELAGAELAGAELAGAEVSAAEVWAALVAAAEEEAAAEEPEPGLAQRAWVAGRTLSVVIVRSNSFFKTVHGRETYSGRHQHRTWR